VVYFPRLEGEAEEVQDEEMEQVPGVDEEKDPRRSKLHRKHVVATQPDTEPTYYFDSFLLDRKRLTEKDDEDLAFAFYSKLPNRRS
jgi:hypothetical protein